MRIKRDDFSSETIEVLKRRAAYICSNPGCLALTISASELDKQKAIYIGKAAHITAASQGGPRYDSTLSSQDRSSIDNAIFLCSSCADMIDKNNGVDFTVELLKKWKVNHEQWTKSNLNKKMNIEGNSKTTINVSSYDQKGGITAGIVNLGKPQRNLTQQLANLMDKVIAENPTREIKIITEMNDSETYRLGEQVLNYLISKGHNVPGGVGRMMASQPIKSRVNLNSIKPVIEIFIGSQ